MLLLGRLYDLSDRELCTEIQMHVGMRWFCRLQLHDEVPDHSTLSKLKDKWAEAGVFQQVFDRVVRQCSEVGLVSGRHLSVDGTEVKASASMKSLSPARATTQARAGRARGRLGRLRAGAAAEGHLERARGEVLQRDASLHQ